MSPAGFCQHKWHAASSKSDLDATEVGNLTNGRTDGSLQVAVPAAVEHDGFHGGEQAAIGDAWGLALHCLDEAVRHGANRSVGLGHLHACKA